MKRIRDIGDKIKKRGLLLLLPFMLPALCACSALEEAGTDGALALADYGNPATIGDGTVSYELPVIKPNVFVDRLGYEPESSKIVIFQGKELPERFTVREAESRKIVYTGEIRVKGTDRGDTAYNSYGDFSDFKTPGSYYIQIDRYGESYPFIIHDNLYYSFFKRACGRLSAMRSGADGGWKMQETGEKREIDACLSLYQLLLSYEMFPEVYTDDTGIAESGNGVPDILDECRYELEWLIRNAGKEPESGGAACGYRAATLAKYAYLTKNIDSAFAGECLSAAEAAWKNTGKNLSAADDLVALAAAELYRLTGSRQYEALAEEYLADSAQKEARLSDLEFFAGITYMNTKSKVDVALCDLLIKKIMAEAEEIAQRSQQNRFLIDSEGEEADCGTLLRGVLRICVVNHIITNHEYGIIVENHFHYLMGRNPDSICHASYLEGQNLQTEDIMEDPVENTAFIFMLSELIGNQ